MKFPLQVKVRARTTELGPEETKEVRTIIYSTQIACFRSLFIYLFLLICQSSKTNKNVCSGCHRATTAISSTHQSAAIIRS